MKYYNLARWWYVRDVGPTSWCQLPNSVCPHSTFCSRARAICACALQSTWEAALHSLAEGIQQLQHNACASAAPSGSIRLEVEFPGTFTSLEWLLAHSPHTTPVDTPSNGDVKASATPAAAATAQRCLQVYFSPRHSPQPAADAVCSPTVAGVPRCCLYVSLSSVSKDIEHQQICSFGA